MEVQLTSDQNVYVWGPTASDTFSVKIHVSWLYERIHKTFTEIYLEDKDTTKN
jgi:hypothetical protein